MTYSLRIMLFNPNKKKEYVMVKAERSMAEEPYWVVFHLMFLNQLQVVLSLDTLNLAMGLRAKENGSLTIMM